MPGRKLDGHFRIADDEIESLWPIITRMSWTEVEMCRSRWALMALLVWVGSALADSNKTKVPSNSSEVEIRLTDGSRVRMLVLEETLNIATKYGRLTIPISDLHRLELGIRRRQ
jgi:hypothetical protein